MIDESPDQPRDENPDAGAPEEAAEPPVPAEPPAQPDSGTEPPAQPDSGAEPPAASEEGVEPTAAPDEPPAEAADVPSAETPADVPAEAPQAPADDIPSAETPADVPAEAPQAPADDAAQAQPEGDAAAAAEPAAGDAAPQERRPRKAKGEDKSDEPEVIPGAHLEPDLVLEQPADAESDQYAQYADADAEGDAGEGDGEAAGDAEAAPAARTPLELAADARYQATGKRKTAIARVILKPGSGVYTINGKQLDVYFPRPRLQHQSRQPLETTGNDKRMDVIARIHGGGVAAQAGALRHGISRALVEAEPTLRVELKRRGFLTRDPREKERRKAGLKKARKRPQFSKR
jgi:small subunit ribosomal protein S9